MPREEIQKANPGGVRNRRVPRADENLPPGFDCAPPAFGNRLLLPRRNLAALLSAVCGAFALLGAVCGSLALTGSSRWAASPGSFVLPAFWIGGFFAIAACVLGIKGIDRRLECPNAGGLPWATGGLVAFALTLPVYAILFIVAVCWMVGW